MARSAFSAVYEYPLAHRSADCIAARPVHGPCHAEPQPVNDEHATPAPCLPLLTSHCRQTNDKLAPAERGAPTQEDL